MRLNGWQRLWVTLAISWLLVVATAAWVLKPSAKDSFASDVRWNFEVLALDGERIEFTSDRNASPTVSELEQIFLTRENLPKADGREIVIVGDDGNEHVFPSSIDPRRAAAIVRHTLASTITASTPDGKMKYAVGTAPEELQRRYREKALAASRVSQAKFFLQTAAIWALPLIALYLSGFSVAWIRRGFRAAATENKGVSDDSHV